MNQRQRQSDDQSRRRGELRPVGNRQNHQHKDEGHNDFQNQNASGTQSQRAGLAIAVLSERIPGTENHPQEQRCGQSADALCDHIPHTVLYAHPTRRQHTDRNRRIDMTSGDIPDRVSHRHHRQPERKRDQQCGKRNRNRRVHTEKYRIRRHRGSASERRQHKRSDKFRNILSHLIIPLIILCFV